MEKRIWKNKSVIQLMKEGQENDPIETVRLRTRHLVLDAFEKGWSGPPFDPFKLARLLNISISPNETIKDARILSNDGKFQIEYNPYQKQSRINFSVSHEIGHFLFSDWKQTIRNREEEKI